MRNLWYATGKQWRLDRYDNSEADMSGLLLQKIWTLANRMTVAENNLSHQGSRYKNNLIYFHFTTRENEVYEVVTAYCPTLSGRE